ncbi:hypothetical protein TpMuguga_01g00178 [Theileria parva strain Muguga]|uniref:Uncharacterized protein n=1 Tax=Theileria parva TaxID=5875 RepID=Q4N9D6_THEPA|nr:uncharacterized protein TpMuguga_01g00178 [Theileria parva strain Muguga]EAN33422.1 hypothetical protein TpMuguga_01g00178 [Theileria parva strain Muguga]|eukprot:XP_765705.1 hypothetical protein [Theileria parva strain Muguga]
MNCFYILLFIFSLFKTAFSQTKPPGLPCVLNISGNNDRTKIDIDDKDSSVTIFTPTNGTEVLEVVYGSQVLWKRTKLTKFLRLLTYKRGNSLYYLQLFFSRGGKIYAQTMSTDGEKWINSTTFRLTKRNSMELFGDLNLTSGSSEDENPYENPDQVRQEGAENEPNYADSVILQPKKGESDEDTSESDSSSTKSEPSLKSESDASTTKSEPSDKNKLKSFGKYLKNLARKGPKKKGESTSNTDSEGESSGESTPINKEAKKPPQSKYRVEYEDLANLGPKPSETETGPKLPKRSPPVPPVRTVSLENKQVEAGTRPSSPTRLSPIPEPRTLFPNKTTSETETGSKLPKRPPEPPVRTVSLQNKQVGNSASYVSSSDSENSETDEKPKNRKRRRINFFRRGRNNNNTEKSVKEDPIYSTIDLQPGQQSDQTSDESTPDELSEPSIEESNKTKMRPKRGTSNSLNRVRKLFSRRKKSKTQMNEVELDLAGDLEGIARVKHVTEIDIPVTEMIIFGGNLVKKITDRFQTVWKHERKSLPLRQVLLFAKPGYQSLLHLNTKPSLFEGNPRMYEDIEGQWLEITLERFLTKLGMSAFNEVDTYYENKKITSDTFEIPEEFTKPDPNGSSGLEPGSRRSSTSSTGSESNYSVRSIEPHDSPTSEQIGPVETDDTESVSGGASPQAPAESIYTTVTPPPKPPRLYIYTPKSSNGDIIPEQESGPATVTPYESSTGKTLGESGGDVHSTLGSKSSDSQSSGSSFERISTPDLENLPPDSSIRPLLMDEGLNLYSSDGF